MYIKYTSFKPNVYGGKINSKETCQSALVNVHVDLLNSL